MTWKGHTFVEQDAPRSIRNGPAAAVKEWCDANTARYAIVHKCAVCKEPVIAEEIVEHRVAHVSDNARAVVRTVLMLTPKEIAEVLAVVNEIRGVA